MTQPWQFPVKQYGAVGNGVTNDLTAINAAITAATAYMTGSGTPGYAEVLFDPDGVYFVGATAPSTAFRGNAQIPLPIIPVTSQKPTLALKSTSGQASGFYHWQQTTPQMPGATIYSTYAGGTSPTVNREPSVIGGPTPVYGATVNISGVTTANPGVVTTSTAHNFTTGQQVVVASVGGATQANGTWAVTVVDATHFSVPVNVTGTYSSGGTANPEGYGASGLFTNLLVVIDGITVMCPPNPQVAAIDLRGVAEMQIGTAAALCYSTSLPPPRPTAGSSGLWSWGLWPPMTNNNDLSYIARYTCEGFPMGIVVEEHIEGNYLGLVNCYDGMVLQSQTGFPHGNQFTYVSIENCYQCIATTGAGQNRISINRLDIEWDSVTGGPIINDSAGYPTVGEIFISSTGGGSANPGATLAAAMTSGINANVFDSFGCSMKLICDDVPQGTSVGSPTVPATTVALLNPNWRDAFVAITAGASTCAVAIGAVTGTMVTTVTIPSGGQGYVHVPTGQYVKLTYTAAPTWVWTLV